MTDQTGAERPGGNVPAENGGTPEPPTTDAPMDVRSVTLSVLAVIGTILMLQYAQPVLIPIVVGILISYVLAPAVSSMEKRRIPRVVGSFVAIAILCGGIGFGGYALTDEAMDIVESVPVAARRLVSRLEARRGQPEGAIEKVQTAAKEIERAAERASEPETAPRGVQRVQVVEPAFAARQYLWAGWLGLTALLGQTAMVLFLVFFLLVTGDLFKRKLVKIAGPTLTKKKISVQIMDDINRQISSFLRVQVITSALVGVVTALVLWWFGVQNFVIWGLLAGIFNSVPYLGPLMVTAGLALVTFLQFDDLLKTSYVAGATLAITSLEGWLLTPALMSRAAQMNPVAIFIGLLFWSWVWGVWGTILAVPMMMTLKAIADRVESLQPVGELLGE
jgi:predicted PurR-regulated permease PerM